MVFGKGFKDARAVIIGEAPGAQEDESGVPFVGPAGKVLDDILAHLGLKYSGKKVPQNRRVFITNVVKCNPRQNRRNRAPKAGEVLECRPWLVETLRHIRPNILIMLGRISEAAIVGRRGFTYPMVLRGVLLYEVTHPAAYLRNTKSLEDDVHLWNQISKDLLDCTAANHPRPEPDVYDLPLLIQTKKEEANG